MTSYIITITPEDPGNTQTATLRIRTSEDQVFLTEVHVQADPGLADNRILGIDFGLLIRAVSAANPPPGRSAVDDGTRKALRGRTTERDSDARVYRRLPDDFVTVYQKTGGATATARHYGVPRHTVQGWLRRLRQEGVLPAGQ